MSSRPTNQEPSREKYFLFHKQNSERRVSDNGGRRFQLPKARLRRLILSPIRFLKHFAGEIARGVCMVSSSGKRKPSSRSGKSSFSARSKPFVAPLDSHRVEAIEDCIQFINSSSTFSRSNSTTSTTTS